MIKGLEHTAIVSPDADRLAEWYVKWLDFVVESKSAKSGTYFLRGQNGSRIEVILTAGGAQAPEVKDAGLRHLALITDSFDEDCARVRASGAAIVSEPEIKSGNRVVFFRDPDGNILHLIQREKPLE
jgi:glyoxylase I family protein